ncbi:diguanylate cyclase [Sulfuricella sp. T08]|nr:diguanylate cyclase [Sulfuricella sp. T08]
MAGEVQSFIEKNAYYEALGIFNEQENTFKREFAEQMKRQLDPFVDHSSKSSSQPEREFSEFTLALVEEDEFEEWLAYSDMARKLEAEFQDQLNELNLRLNILVNESVDKETNPFAPGSFGKGFQDTLKTVALDHKALQVSYATFKEVLSASLGEMYDDINKYLNENGVKLDLRRQYKIKPSSESIPRPTPEAQKPAEKSSPQQPSPSEKLEPIPDSQTTGDGSFSAGRRQSDNISRSAPAPQDWYSLVQYLGNLQQNVAHQGGYRPTGMGQPQPFGGGPVADTAQIHQFYTPDELLSALSRIHFSEKLQPFAGGFQQDVKSQLMSVLAHGNEDGENKQLPEREGRILDIAGNLFDSVLEDKLVANNVRPWLQQFSIPMVKVALQDDSLFSDKSHLARQVINSLAQLELYGEENGDMGHNAVRKRINHLIAEVASAEDVTPQLFEKMLKDFRSLIRLQDKAYKENLEDVYAVCEEEQRISETKGTNHAAADSSDGKQEKSLGASASGDDGLSEWKKQARRLKVGDWILFDDAIAPQRRRLAWISRNSERFVFVNVKGLKELTLSQAELAQQLRNGTSVVLDDGGEPLIDRAQTAMLQKMHRQLLHESTHDQLTGLINRREFERFLAQALASAHQLSQRHAICYIDLDQFSVVNNTFGYGGGDRLLVEVTKLLKDELGDQGIVARIGGDEFGMLFENGTVEEALEIIARQKAAIKNYRFISDEKSLAISFSAGLVSIEPESDSVATLLQAAEASCRSARGKGTNYIQVYSPDDEEMTRHKQAVEWVTKIDEALDNDSLVLRYQPIARITRKNPLLHHAEILLGVPDEQGNLMSPVDFIFAAESFRRMVAVDRWVIQHVFRWMGTHGRELDEMGGLAINLSGASLNEEGFIDFVLQQAKILMVPMEKVCFEVTETAGIANLSNASEFILEVKKTGCTFALDDFGSGLSSYAYLKNLPVDFLKIDGAFVKDMDSNPYDYAVVKSITEIGHFMGKGIIAEYVENENILNMLREIGVDYAQGYVIGKPLALSLLAA